MASVIVVDTELKELVREYAGIIDGVNKNTAFADALPQFFTPQIQRESLLKQIYEVSTPEIYTKLSDKEFEATANLLIHLVAAVSNDFAGQIDLPDAPIYPLLRASVPKKQPSLRERKALKPTTVVSVFNQIFNLVPPTLSTRLFLLQQILAIVELLKIDIGLFEDNIGANLVLWLTAANIPVADIKLVFWLFISLDKSYSQKLLTLISNFTKQFPVDAPEIKQLIEFALASEVVDVSFLVNTDVAAALAANQSDPIVALFAKYVRGEPVTAIDGVLSTVDAKLKILVLARFFADAGKNQFAYSDIPVARDELEPLVVGAIKAGVVEGKLDQVQEQFHLTRVNKFIVAGESHAAEWAAVKELLVQWKASLANINEVVKTLRESIVNANA